MTVNRTEVAFKFLLNALQNYKHSLPLKQQQYFNEAMDAPIRATYVLLEPETKLTDKNEPMSLAILERALPFHFGESGEIPIEARPEGRKRSWWARFKRFWETL